MRPVLFEVFGLTVTSYGVSKALAAVVAGVLLSREFRRRGWDHADATTLVLWTAVAGFAGAKAYYLLENLPDLAPHDLGAAGFTWYGGLLGGLAALVLFARRAGLPVPAVAAVAAAPASFAYAVGRLGCLLAGDGTTGTPSDLPWAVRIPAGMVPTVVPVHPTPAYEALAAIVIGLGLWALRRRVSDLSLIGLYALASGAARWLVELVRTNEQVLLGQTAAQLWSLALAAAGALLLLRQARPTRRAPADARVPSAVAP